MAGENVISYTDMDINEAINDFSNGFINEILLSKTLTYAAKQLVIKHQRNSALAILQGRDEANRLRENYFALKNYNICCQTACDQTSKKQRFGHFTRKR